MEEDKKVEVQAESKKFDFKKIDYKKYLPYVGIALAIIVVIIILVAALGGGPKKAVKNFVSGMNKQNVSKVVKSMDLVGSNVWSYKYNSDDFSDDDYDEFIENYKDVDKDEIKEDTKDMESELEDDFDEIDDTYKSYKIKIDKFKEVEKLGKDLYAVDAKISVEATPKDKDETDEIDEASVVTFIVYKNKVIYAGRLGI